MMIRHFLEKLKKFEARVFNKALGISQHGNGVLYLEPRARSLLETAEVVLLESEGESAEPKKRVDLTQSDI